MVGVSNCTYKISQIVQNIFVLSRDDYENITMHGKPVQSKLPALESRDFQDLCRVLPYCNIF